MRKTVVLGVCAVIFLAFINATIAEPKMKFDFEKKELGEGWEVEGDAAVSQEKAHAGKGSLKMLPKSLATFTFSDNNKFANAVFWILESGSKLTHEGNSANGPRWGIKNADDDKLCIELVWRTYCDDSGYCFVSTMESAWSSPWWTSLSRKKEWCKWEFDFTTDEGRMVNADDATVKVDMEKVFKGGMTGLYFQGMDESAGPFYVDDIDIKVKK